MLRISNNRLTGPHLALLTLPSLVCYAILRLSNQQKRFSVSHKYVLLKELAEELLMDRSHLRKYVKKMEINANKVRTPQSGNQLTLAVTEDEAKRIRNNRLSEGFSSSSGKSGKVTTAAFGEFYLVVLDPEARPNRVKMGFSDYPEGRLATYRTSNPGAMMLHSWPCKSVWEKAAIAACSNAEGTEQVSGEVFDVNSIEETVSRGNQFFKLVTPSDIGVES